MHFLLIISVSHGKWHSENWKFMFDSAANEVIKIASFACPAIQQRHEHSNRSRENVMEQKTLTCPLAGNCMQCHHRIFMPFFIQTVVVLLTFDKLHRLTSFYWVPLSIGLFFFSLPSSTIRFFCCGPSAQWQLPNWLNSNSQRIKLNSLFSWKSILFFIS